MPVGKLGLALALLAPLASAGTIVPPGGFWIEVFDPTAIPPRAEYFEFNAPVDSANSFFQEEQALAQVFPLLVVTGHECPVNLFPFGCVVPDDGPVIQGVPLTEVPEPGYGWLSLGAAVLMMTVRRVRGTK